MQRKSSIEQVVEFHKTFQPATVVAEPTYLTSERAYLRFSLIMEELQELADAIGMQEELAKAIVNRPRIVDSAKEREAALGLDKALDAVADLQYVLDGTIAELGLDKFKNEAFSRVHISNMSKVCTTGETLQKTIEKYKKEGIQVLTQEVEGVEGKGYVVRRPDGKVLKSVEFKPPYFGDLWSGKQ